MPIPSPALVDDSRAAAPVGGTALGLQSSKKFGPAQHARQTLSSYVPSELYFASGRCRNGTAGRPHAPTQQQAYCATPSRPSTAAHHPWRGQVGSRLRWKKMISSGGFRLLPPHHEVQQLTSGWSGHCGGAWAPASRLPHVGRRRIDWAGGCDQPLENTAGTP